MRIKYLIGILLTMATLHNYGQTNYLPHIINGDIYEIETPTKVLPADLDADGDLDILVLGRTLGWHQNEDGLGGFGMMNSIPSAIDFVRDAAAGDIDSDGDMDIVTVSQGAEGLVWYENTDDAIRFRSAIAVDTDCTRCLGVELMDTDSDGDLDLVILRDDLLLIASNDSGQFGTAFPVLNLNGAVFFDLRDMDGDGFKDLVVASRSRISWANNMGTNSFSSAFKVIGSMPYLTSFHIVDYDEDGDLDVFSTSTNGGDLLLHRNLDGNGQFGSNVVEDLASSFFVTSVDVDEDGDLDLITSNTKDGLSFHENIANTFVPSVLLDDTSQKYIDLIPADITGDGMADLVGCSEDEREVVWYENTTDELVGPQKIISSNLSTFPSDLIIVDLDADGYDDVFYSSHFLDKISWQKNLLEGETGFAPPEELYHLPSFATNDMNFAHPVDMDFDGDVDIIMSSSFRSVLTYYENVGDGTYTISSNLVAGNTPLGRITTYDLDQDGDLDLLYSSDDNSEYGVIENTSGILGPLSVSRVGTGNGSVHVDVADIDGDGYADLVATTRSLDYIYWYRYNPSVSTFGNEIRIESTYQSGRRSTIIRDIDGDGDNDLLSAVRDLSINGSSAYLEWYENKDGVGTWADPVLLYTVADDSFLDMDVGDLDNDGDNDIAFTDRDLNSLFVLENLNGAGMFAEAELISDELSSAQTVRIADMDRDGMNDLVTLSYHENRVMWFDNDGLLQNRVGGHVYVAVDSFSCDSLRLGAEGIPVHLQYPNGDILSRYTNARGYYDFKVDSGMYVLEIGAIALYDVADPKREIDLPGQDSLAIGYDFCLQPVDSVTNVSISLIPITEARPGFDSRYRLVMQNRGNIPSSGKVTFRYDVDFQVFVSSDSDASFLSDGLLEFSYDALYPFQRQTIDVVLKNQVPPTLNNGDILYHTSSIIPASFDIDNSDNKLSSKQDVVGSFDPNDISVAQGASILIDEAEDYLHYHIRFQNTGSAEAINVRVENSIEEDLDPSSFSIIDLSHPGTVQITDRDSLAFIFDGIYLPDSTTNEAQSHGYISYKIKAREGYDVGSVFSNVVDIYFDFNLPITTNTVETEIVEPISTDNNPVLPAIQIPSLVTSNVTLSTQAEFSAISLYSSSQRIEMYDGSIRSIELQGLPVGIYFLVFHTTEGYTVTKKFIKINQ